MQQLSATRAAAALAFFAAGRRPSAVSGAQRVRLPEVEQFLPSLKFCPLGILLGLT